MNAIEQLLATAQAQTVLTWALCFGAFSMFVWWVSAVFNKFTDTHAGIYDSPEERRKRRGGYD
jgi:hypothetical protein